MDRQYRFWKIPFILLFLVFIFTGCSGDPRLDVLHPSGSAGEKQLNLIMWSFFLMVGVFAIVITIYVYVLIRFRKRKGKDITPKQVHGNMFLEIIWTVIPIVLLAVLAVPTVKYTFELADPTRDENSIFIRVTGHQYWWEFEYPDLGIKTAQEIHIPVGKKVFLELHGKDVLHAFWVPALGGKTDIVPGRVNTMWLDAKKAGEYYGKCAELCGSGHALMDFKVYADSTDAFDHWVKQMKRPQATARTSAQKEGQALFMQNCMGCHAGADPAIPGPNLTKFATRKHIAGFLANNETNLRKWLQNPDSVKPGAQMPKIDYLNPSEMNSLIEYLMDRK